MWDCCCESVRKVEKSGGSGCILAHCMGLGKTLQVSHSEGKSDECRWVLSLVLFSVCPTGGDVSSHCSVV